MQIVGGVISGFGSGGPSCCPSAERQKRWHSMLSLSRSLRQGWGGGGICGSCGSAISVMSGLFLHIWITPTSPNCINMLYRYEYCWQCLTYEYCVMDPHSWKYLLMIYDCITLSSIFLTQWKIKCKEIILGMQTFPNAHSNYLLKEIILTFNSVISKYVMSYC